MREEMQFMVAGVITVLSQEYHDDPAHFLVTPSFISNKQKTYLAREIPVGSIVRIVSYNIGREDKEADMDILWNGTKYRVKAPMSSFTSFSQPDQKVQGLQKGKLYRFCDLGGQTLFNGRDVRGTVHNGDPVVYLEHKVWEDDSRPAHGYHFKVIAGDVVGWVGQGAWCHLEPLKDEGMGT